MQLKFFTNSVGWILAILSLPILGLAVFTLQNTRGGRTRSARVIKEGGSVLLNQFAMEYGYWLLRGPANWLIARRISPNAISISGLGVVFLGAVATAMGY